MLATAHAERGVDAVPVVFAVLDGGLVVPIDLVKPKASTRLQRTANLERDPRAALLVEHYDDDWSQRWWVRVHGRAVERPPTTEALDALAARYPAYAEPGTIASTIVLTPELVTGWSAAAAR